MASACCGTSFYLNSSSGASFAASPASASASAPARHKNINNTNSSSVTRSTSRRRKELITISTPLYFSKYSSSSNAIKEETRSWSCCCCVLLNHSKSRRLWRTILDLVNDPSIDLHRFLLGRRFPGFLTMDDPFTNGSSSLSSSKSSTLTTSNYLRHVDSMATLPSGAGRIGRLNAVILGEALASEEDDLVVPSTEFSANAHIPSPDKVRSIFSLIIMIIYVPLLVFQVVLTTHFSVSLCWCSIWRCTKSPLKTLRDSGPT